MITVQEIHKSGLQVRAQLHSPYANLTVQYATVLPSMRS
jgi:hypothetical protein